jgi:predicted acyltransferase (DUF342 family)
MLYNPFMVFERRTLVIPDETKFDEHMIITNGDVIIGDRCLIQFGIKTNGRIFIGEHAIIDGDLIATEDVRVDIFSRIRGNITSNENVYLGEKVIVEERLSVTGDLDVGDSVDVKKGFEAKGWINIRSPIPVVIYIFIYLTQLLKLGHSEEIERILEEIEDNEEGTIPISEVFLFIPNNSMIGLQNSKIEGNIRLGRKSRLLGNFNVKGKSYISDETILFGSIKSDKEIYIGKKAEVKGSISTQESIRIDEEAIIKGDINALKIHLSKTTQTNGTLYAKQGISFITPYDYQSAEKIRRFEEDLEILDNISDEKE